MKNLNPLYEFITMATVGAGMLGLGAISTFKNMNQNGFNKKMSNIFLSELYKTTNKQQALQVLDKYCNKLQQMNTDKSLQKKIAAAQYFLKSNYYSPCIQIIKQYDDKTWKTQLMSFVKKNRRKLSISSGLKSAATIGSLTLSGGAMAGSVTMGMAAMANSIYRIVKRNLQFFNSNRYINKLIKELEQCPDNDKQMAINIINKYCYNISTDIENNINKTKKKVPFNIQQKIRQQFVPIFNIMQQNSNYWKIQCIDYLKTNKIQEGTQVICDSVLYYILPRVVRKNG